MFRTYISGRRRSFPFHRIQVQQSRVDGGFAIALYTIINVTDFHIAERYHTTTLNRNLVGGCFACARNVKVLSHSHVYFTIVDGLPLVLCPCPLSECE